MWIPKINHEEIRKTIELAEEFLIPYKTDLDYQEQQLAYSQIELSAAKTIVALIKRGETRTEILKDLAGLGDYYCGQFMKGDLQKLEQFISILEYRVSSFTRRIEKCNEAINTLNSDISDLKKLLNIAFNDMITYLVYLGDSPGSAFYMYRPEQWLARWSCLQHSQL